MRFLLWKKILKIIRVKRKKLRKLKKQKLTRGIVVKRALKSKLTRLNRGAFRYILPFSTGFCNLSAKKYVGRPRTFKFKRTNLATPFLEFYRFAWKFRKQKGGKENFKMRRTRLHKIFCQRGLRFQKTLWGRLLVNKSINFRGRLVKRLIFRGIKNIRIRRILKTRLLALNGLKLNRIFKIKFIKTTQPLRLVEKRDSILNNYFLSRFNNILMRNGLRHHSLGAIRRVHIFAKQNIESNFFVEWLELQDRLRFPFLLKSYYYRGARGVRLVKYVLARERMERQHVRSLRFLRVTVFKNQNTVFWVKLFNEYYDFLLAERGSLIMGLEQLTTHAVAARGDRLDAKYHQALEKLEHDPELHFRW